MLTPTITRTLRAVDPADYGYTDNAKAVRNTNQVNTHLAIFNAVAPQVGVELGLSWVPYAAGAITMGVGLNRCFDALSGLARGDTEHALRRGGSGLVLTALGGASIALDSMLPGASQTVNTIAAGVFTLFTVNSLVNDFHGKWADAASDGAAPEHLKTSSDLQNFKKYLEENPNFLPSDETRRPGIALALGKGVGRLIAGASIAVGGVRRAFAA